MCSFLLGVGFSLEPEQEERYINIPIVSPATGSHLGYGRHR